MAEVVIALSAVIALFMLGSSILKIAALGTFRGQLAGFAFLPRRLLPTFSVLVPTAELAAGGALLVPATRTAGAIGVIALLAVFSAVAARALRSGLSGIPCACFGAVSQELDRTVIVRNVALMFALVPVLFLGDSAMSSAGVAGAVVAAILLWVAVEVLRVWPERWMSRAEAVTAR